MGCKDIFSDNNARLMVDDDTSVVDCQWPKQQHHQKSDIILPRMRQMDSTDDDEFSSRTVLSLQHMPMEVGKKRASSIRIVALDQQPSPYLSTQRNDDEDEKEEKYLYCFEYRHGDDYRMIEDRRRRKIIIWGILIILLPSAYISGLLVGGAFKEANLQPYYTSQKNETFQQAPHNSDTVNNNLDENGNETNVSGDEESVSFEPTPNPQSSSHTVSPSIFSNPENVQPQFPNFGSSRPVSSPAFPPPTTTVLPTVSPLIPPPSLPTVSSPIADIVWTEVPKSETNHLASGPLVGHTTYHTSKLWAYQGDGKVMQLIYYPTYRFASMTGRMARVVDMIPNSTHNNASIVEINSLEPDTEYQYEIRIANQWIAKGQFQTSPEPGRPTEFTYLLASCMDVKRSSYSLQPVWDVIRRIQQPDFAILAGDNVYLNDNDWTTEGEILGDRVWFRNFRQRDESHFARFIANTPTYATWDDHEYGSNNADQNQLGKENSLQAFASIWANPSYGTKTIPGVFYSFVRGDVEFFVMDNRWYREEDETRSQFGKPQKEWLYQSLKKSTAVFKIIVSGSDVMERNRDIDVQEIGSVVTANRISGVLFNAGDIHRNEFKANTAYETWPYPVMQISSSGIARVWRRPFALINANTQLEDPQITVSFYGANSTSLDTTWSNDPNLLCSEVPFGDLQNEHRCTQLIRLSDLSV